MRGRTCEESIYLLPHHMSHAKLSNTETGLLVCKPDIKKRETLGIELAHRYVP